MEYFTWICAVAAVLLLISIRMDLSGRVQRLERKLNLLLRHHGVDSLQGLALSDRVKEIANDPARKIQAIKAYRDETGVGLKEAKDAVEAYMNSK